MCGITRSTSTPVFLAVWTDAEVPGGRWWFNHGVRYPTRRRAAEFDTPQAAWDAVQDSALWDNPHEYGTWSIVVECKEPEPEPVTRLIAYGEDEDEEGAEYVRLGVIRSGTEVVLAAVDASGKREWASTIARFELNKDGKVEMVLAYAIGNPNVATDGRGVIIHEH